MGLRCLPLPQLLHSWGPNREGGGEVGVLRGHFPTVLATLSSAVDTLHPQHTKGFCLSGVGWSAGGKVDGSEGI